MALQVHQARLRGVRVNPFWQEGCPHAYGMPDSVNRCDANEGRPCVYETHEKSRGCEIFRQVLREASEEMADQEVESVV